MKLIAIAFLIGSPVVSATAGDVSVAGIQLGVASSNAKEVMTSVQPPLAIKDLKLAQGIVCHQAFGTLNLSPQRHSGVNIGVCFYPDNKVWFVGKSEHFEAGFRPTVSASLDALKEKYGQPSSLEESEMGFELDWQFDRDGNQYKGPPRNGPCRSQLQRPSGLTFQHPDSRLTISAPRGFYRKCGIVISASLYAREGMIDLLYVNAYDSASQFDANEAAKARDKEDKKQRLDEEMSKAIKPGL